MRVRAARRGRRTDLNFAPSFARMTSCTRCKQGSAMDGLRVSEHASDIGCSRIASVAPRGPLAAYVNAFNAYEEHVAPFRRRRELPDGFAVLIFNLGSELRVEQSASARRSFGEGQGFFSGTSATYVVTETDGASRARRSSSACLALDFSSGCLSESLATRSSMRRKLSAKPPRSSGTAWRRRGRRTRGSICSCEPPSRG
jgi:hypothetical protein